MTSNIGDVIDDVENTRDELDARARDNARDEGNEIEQRADKYLLKDAQWTGRTQQALSMDFDTLKRGKYQASVYVDEFVAPHAKLAEFGSGDRGDQFWMGSETDVDHKSHYRGDNEYDAPEMSDELYLSILAWVQTKPIVESDPEDLAGEITMTIADEGTFQHPFMRPAWEDRAGRPSNNYERSPIVGNIERMLEDIF